MSRLMDSKLLSQKRRSVRSIPAIAAASSALLLVCLYLTLTTGGGLFLLPGVLWLTVNGVLPNGTKHDKISCYNK